MERAGASNMTAFYHAFEKQYGLLPAAYRRENKNAV